jgi:hypothetical protein
VDALQSLDVRDFLVFAAGVIASLATYFGIQRTSKANESSSANTLTSLLIKEYGGLLETAKKEFTDRIASRDEDHAREVTELKAEIANLNKSLSNQAVCGNDICRDIAQFALWMGNGKPAPSYVFSQETRDMFDKIRKDKDD